jgi:hypothetical protein
MIDDVFRPSELVNGKTFINDNIKEHKNKAIKLLAEVMRLYTTFTQRLSAIKSRDKNEWMEMMDLSKATIDGYMDEYGNMHMLDKDEIIPYLKRRYGYLFELYNKFCEIAGNHLTSMKNIFKLLMERDTNSILSMRSLIDDITSFQYPMHDHNKGMFAANYLHHTVELIDEFIDHLSEQLKFKGGIIRVAGIDKLKTAYERMPTSHKGRQVSLGEIIKDHMEDYMCFLSALSDQCPWL